MRIAVLAAAFAASLAFALPASALTVEASLSPALVTKLDKQFYSAGEADVLINLARTTVDRVLTQRGVKADKVVVTIEDAEPSSSRRAGLSVSASLGGAKVTGIAYDASGQEIGRFDNKWYAGDLTNSLAATKWSDAQYSFDRFARKVADKLA